MSPCNELVSKLATAATSLYGYQREKLPATELSSPVFQTHHPWNQAKAAARKEIPPSRARHQTRALGKWISNTTQPVRRRSGIQVQRSNPDALDWRRLQTPPQRLPRRSATKPELGIQVTCSNTTRQKSCNGRNTLVAWVDRVKSFYVSAISKPSAIARIAFGTIHRPLIYHFESSLQHRDPIELAILPIRNELHLAPRPQR